MGTFGNSHETQERLTDNEALTSSRTPKDLGEGRATARGLAGPWTRRACSSRDKWSLLVEKWRYCASWRPLCLQSKQRRTSLTARRVLFSRSVKLQAGTLIFSSIPTTATAHHTCSALNATSQSHSYSANYC